MNSKHETNRKRWLTNTTIRSCLVNRLTTAFLLTACLLTGAKSQEGNPVTTTANYAMLPSGQVYMGQANLSYPKKEVVVQIDNSNYQLSR